MNLPLQSTTRVCGGKTFGPIAAIRSPSITRVLFIFGSIISISAPGRINVPPVSAIFSPCAASTKIDHARASAIFSFIEKRFTLGFTQCKLPTQTPVLPGASLFSLYQSGRFPIERGVIRVARSQIKFVDDNLDQRGSRHCQKNSEPPEHCRGGERKEQDVDRMQSHLFAKHTRHKNIQFDLVNQHDYAERQPEFCCAHA